MKKGMSLVAIFLIFLVVSMPIVFSANQNVQEVISVPVPAQGESYSFNVDVKEDESDSKDKGLLPALQETLTGLQNVSSTYSLEEDAADKCEEKAKKGDEKLAFMDSGVIKGIEGVLNIARAICLTLNAIGDVISTIGVLVVGIQGPDGSVCCLLGWLSLSAACEGEWGVQKSWESVFKYVSPICCYLTCGWCTTGCDGLPGLFKEKSSGFYVIGRSQQTGKIGMWGAGEGGGASAIGLSPYDNIYTAIACLCPGAVLMNLRKLKVIYQTYDCCIEQACKAGQSTEGCEAMLDESTCMFWEGALISSLAKIITKLVVSVVFKYVLSEYLKAAWIQCVIAAIDLIQIPQTIQGIVAEWQRAMKSFDDPNCSDLGFDDINDDFSQANDDLLNRIPQSYEDFDSDGYADGTAEENKALQEEQQRAAYQRAQAERAAWEAQQRQAAAASS